MNQEEQGKKISQLIARCWADEGFKQKVLADPTATLRAEGLELPAGVSYVAHENTEKVAHLVIPAKPTDLSDEDLGHVTGGVFLMTETNYTNCATPAPPPTTTCALCCCTR
jgi:hypothetical protein